MRHCTAYLTTSQSTATLAILDGDWIADCNRPLNRNSVVTLATQSPTIGDDRRLISLDPTCWIADVGNRKHIKENLKCGHLFDAIRNKTTHDWILN